VSNPDLRKLIHTDSRGRVLSTRMVGPTWDVHVTWWACLKGLFVGGITIHIHIDEPDGSVF
jgi:hypothetical protein